ncbi:uncharacterized protein TRIREDRAFT_109729 [Trichoderma reesei QM6a]|uniref:Predicted protein n=2 Tax=Hypocrea jecorina TaxID=51453 RepID=G0RQC3_HYPJQ|nr:uncharacterized protein TRIREDRAFT_109729 [Trichoderma reesei QM6a]EGR46507.1 predicted protein [Trichoderma reesei QM6a]ETS00248.1 hypothetical protein M419DRAFT_10299 [Trichoderma reesei RUT C-30]
MSNIPSPETRTAISSKLTTLIQTIESDPAFDRSSPSGLFHMWDFAKRTEYMLSEVDNIRQPGYEFRLPGQIKITARGDAAAQQLFNDALTRSITLDQLVSGPPMMRAMMGMAGPVSPEIQAASKAVVDAFKQQ